MSDVEIVESIPLEDDVSRHLYFPFMFKYDDLLWSQIFTFQTKNKFCDSVVWRKYAESIQFVHALGREKIERSVSKHKYFGATTGSVSNIRKFSTDSDIRLEVEHDPCKDQGIHHAHLKLLLPDGMKKPTPTDRLEIFSKIPFIFELIEKYD